MSYTRPAVDAANFAATGYTPSQPIRARFPASAYTPSLPLAASLHTVYSKPGGTVANFALPPPEYVDAYIAATVAISAIFEGDFQNVVIDGDISAAVAVTADISAAHGAAGDVVAIIAITAASVEAHGVAGDMAATVPVSAAVGAVHERYELRGEVRQGGILVNRTVRAYRRDTGALVSEGMTVSGVFHLHAGFAPVEFTIMPIDLADEAADFAPPCANRVLSVLAMDA